MVESTIKVIVNISTEFQGHFCGNKRVIRMNPWVEWVNWVSITFVYSKRVIRVSRWVKLVHSKANVTLHNSIEFLCQFSSNNKVIRMNPWLYLVQSTTQVILHSSTEFKGHFFWSKRVMRMNPKVYLIQSTATVILHISTEFQGDFCRIKELLERTHGSKAPSISFYTSPLRSNDIILKMKSCFNISLSSRGICPKIKVPLSSKDIFLEIKEFLEWTHQ